MIATAGHVDHGKSTLVRALTGMEPDRLAEERRRGLTIELGYAWATLPGTGPDDPDVRVAFVDVPGHERFVATMLAGAGAAPSALLVVAADDGWSAQSTEHRDVLALLEVPTVARVVTKADRVDAGRVAAVVAELERATADTTLAGGPVVVTDAVSGRGLAELRATIRHGLRTMSPEPDRGRPRLWTDRAFTIEGAGTVVTGTLHGGRLHVGDRVELLHPAAEAGPLGARIRALQSLGEPVEVAGPGTRVAVNLAGVARDAVTRGDVLVGRGPWRRTDHVDVWIRTTPEHDLDRAGAWHLHVGATTTPARLRPLTGRIAPGSSGAVRVELAAPLPLVAGDRVILRDAGRRAVVAGGIVADPAPPRMPRGSGQRAARADIIHRVAEIAADRARPPGDRLVALAEAWEAPREVTIARAAAGLAATDDLPAGVVALGSVVAPSSSLAAPVASVEALGAGTHAREAVLAAAQRAGADAALAAALPEHLVADGVLVRTAGGFALRRHAGSAERAGRERAAAVVAELDAAPFSPPDLDAIARAHGLDHRELAALVGSGAVVRRGAVAFSANAVTRAAAVLRDLEARQGPFTASQARTALGTTRRFAIPLLEHLDAVGVTRFDGQHRTCTTRGG